MSDKRIVYILTNEAMPGLIKIGYTDKSIEERMKELSRHTGVPLPFSCFYAIQTDNKNLEKMIHEMFDDTRLSSSREFFTIAPEKAKIALEISGGKDVTPNTDIVENQSDLQALQTQRNKNRFNFMAIGIEPNTILQFKKDTTQTCKVLHDDQVEFRGEVTSLSKSALKIINEMGYEWNKIAGPQFWMYKGKTLYELNNSKEY